jgi:hypothetical protein
MHFEYEPTGFSTGYPVDASESRNVEPGGLLAFEARPFYGFSVSFLQRLIDRTSAISQPMI